jgi:hypothetical protein
VQDSAIGRERLQTAHRASGAHDGDEVCCADLAVHERVQRALRVMQALPRQAQIIDHDGERPLDVFPLDGPDGGGGPIGLRSLHSCGWRRCGAAVYRYELSERDFLGFAVLQDLEVFSGQIANDPAVTIRDDGVDAYDVDGNAEARRFTSLRLLT